MLDHAPDAVALGGRGKNNRGIQRVAMHRVVFPLVLPKKGIHLSAEAPAGRRAADVIHPSAQGLDLLLVGTRGIAKGEIVELQPFAADVPVIIHQHRHHAATRSQGGYNM